MSFLPGLSGRECITALQKAGFSVIRQHDSHIVLKKSDPFTQLVVPDHKELDTGTLRAIIGQSNLSVDEFLKLF
jgi:predicted RNA binding protein YcfA (HicA-like mRNA interferase family)